MKRWAADQAAVSDNFGSKKILSCPHQADSQIVWSISVYSWESGTPVRFIHAPGQLSVPGYGLWLCWEILQGLLERSQSTWDLEKNFGQWCESDYAEEILRQVSTQPGFMRTPLGDTSHQ